MATTITITGMADFNPRKDRSRHYWFRVDNTIIFSEKLEGLTAAQKWLWMFLISLASFKQTDTVDYNLEYFEKHSGAKKSEIESAIELFEQRRMISVSAPYNDCSIEGSRHLGTNGDKCLATNNTNNTIQTNNNAQPVGRATVRYDFNSIYEIYPRHEGKAKGLAKCKSEIKTSEDYAKLKHAVTRYREHIEAKRIEPQFIKHFSSFMTSWRDWLDEDVGNVISISTVPAQGSFESEWVYIHQGVSKFGAVNAKDARDWLGPERWRAVEQLGGWGKLCRMSDDSFTKNSIIKALKETLNGGAG